MSITVHGVEHRYHRGDAVEVLTDGPKRWVLAIVTKHEPYRGNPGYYVSYPAATEQWHCHCGWKTENCVREVKHHAAREDAWERMTQHTRLQTGNPLPCPIPFGPLRIDCPWCDAERGTICATDRPAILKLPHGGEESVAVVGGTAKRYRVLSASGQVRLVPTHWVVLAEQVTS